MRWILIACVLTSSVAVCSSSYAAATATVAGAATVEAAPEACAEDDLDCVLRLLQQKAIEVESLARQLALTKEQYRSAQDLIDVWKAQALAARDAAKEAMASLKPSPWYMSPVLWTAVGVTVGAALAIGLAYALKPLFPSR